MQLRGGLRRLHRRWALLSGAWAALVIFSAGVSTPGAQAATQSPAPGELCAGLPQCQGYWVATSIGHIYPYGAAGYYGSPAARGLRLRNVVALAPVPSDGGYWLLTASGSVYAYGSAVDAGSLSPRQVQGTAAVALASTLTGNGYWILTANGRVWPFGAASRLGGVPITRGSSDRAVGLMVDQTGRGYWIATRNGHVFARGDAPRLGSPISDGYRRRDITSIAGGWQGDGYWVATQTGRVFAFGTAPYLGAPSTNGTVSVSGAYTADGYWVGTALGRLYAYGRATTFPAERQIGRVVAIAATSHPSLPLCAPDQLRLTVQPGPMTAGVSSDDFGLIDATATRCTITGPPSVTIVMPSGTSYPVATTVPYNQAALLVMAPNGVTGPSNPGSTLYGYVGVPSGTAACPQSTSMAMSIPSLTGDLMAAGVQLPVCGAATNVTATVNEFHNLAAG